MILAKPRVAGNEGYQHVAAQAVKKTRRAGYGLSQPLVDMDVEPAKQDSMHDLFEAQRPRLFNFCLRMVAHRQTAEDLTQDVFIKVLQHVQRAGSDAATPALLFAVARHHCLDFLRRNRSWTATWERLVNSWLGHVRDE